MGYIMEIQYMYRIYNKLWQQEFLSAHTILCWAFCTQLFWNSGSWTVTTMLRKVQQCPPSCLFWSPLLSVVSPLHCLWSLVGHHSTLLFQDIDLVSPELQKSICPVSDLLHLIMNSSSSHVSASKQQAFVSHTYILCIYLHAPCLSSTKEHLGNCHILALWIVSTNTGVYIYSWCNNFFS